MLSLIKFIIQRMLDWYKRAWQIFFPLFAVFLLGAVQIVIYLGEKWFMPIMAIALSIIALICLVVALISITRDIGDARQRDGDTKKEEIRKALREAVKRLNPEYTEEQIDTWINKE